MSSSRGFFGWSAATSSSGGSSSRTAGSLAASSWLRTIGATPPIGRWHVEVTLDTSSQRPPTDFDERIATRFQIGIYSEEWGFFFCHGGRASWIRITDTAFVHGRDDFGLLAVTPSLNDVGQLVRRIEQHHGIRFQRQHSAIRTSIAGSEPAIASWTNAL